MGNSGTFRLGSPNVDLLPLELLVHASQKLVEGRQRDCLTYGEVQGDYSLRSQILAQYSGYYSQFEPEQVLLTYGITEAISLVARTLLRRGDRVAVEAPTYYWALPEFTSRGANAIQVPIDENGMRVDLLEAALSRAQDDGCPVRLIYCMPTFQNPTGFTLSLDRRHQLLEVARKFDALVLEDDAYYLLRYSGDELPPLITLDERGRVIHSSTFSKVIAPGIRMGWLMTRSPELMQALMRLKPNGTNPFIAAAAVHYLKSGTFDSHIIKIREFYRESCEICSEELAALRSLNIRVSKPSGGFYYWLELPRHWSAEEFAQYCTGRELQIFCGDNFFAQSPTAPCVRLAFSSFNHDDLRMSLRTLCALAEDYNRLAETEMANT